MHHFNLTTAFTACDTASENAVLGNYIDSRSAVHVDAPMCLIDIDVRYLER